MWLFIYVFTAVVMTATRELAMQIGQVCRKFTKALDLHTVQLADIAPPQCVPIC